MNISIIGEATNRILKTDSEISISNAKQIVGTRNYLIHGYDSLRLEMIWAIVINDLPKLKHEVISLLNPDKTKQVPKAETIHNLVSFTCEGAS